MITREVIRELAAFESPAACAVSFYFQPHTPQNQSHREEVIQAKDLARQALHEAEKNGRNAGARSDLRRILALAEQLHGNHALGKAVFACGAEGLWREFDLPARLARSELVIGSHFHLKPLAPLLGGLPRCAVVVFDHERARVFEMSLGHLDESTGIFAAITRRGRSDGWSGYEAGHAQRRLRDDALHHLKHVAERLKHLATRGGCEKLVVGCREETWHELEPHLHVYVKQRLLGRFPADPLTVTPEQVRERTLGLLEQHRTRRAQELLQEVLGQSHRQGRGVAGLREVLRCLERGEVQAVLLGESFAGRGSQCRACGRLDSRILHHCPLCGQECCELADVTDALLAHLVRGGIEVLHLSAAPALERAGGIAALLRFRATQGTTRRLAV